MSTHYAVLGIDASCSHSEIKKAFHKIARMHHPDRNPNGDVELFKKAVEAHEVLGDPIKRKEYDSELLRTRETTYFSSGASYPFAGDDATNSFFTFRAPPSETRSRASYTPFVYTHVDVDLEDGFFDTSVTDIADDLGAHFFSTKRPQRSRMHEEEEKVRSRFKRKSRFWPSAFADIFKGSVFDEDDDANGAIEEAIRRAEKERRKKNKRSRRESESAVRDSSSSGRQSRSESRPSRSSERSSSVPRARSMDRTEPPARQQNEDPIVTKLGRGSSPEPKIQKRFGEPPDARNRGPRRAQPDPQPKPQPDTNTSHREDARSSASRGAQSSYSTPGQESSAASESAACPPERRQSHHAGGSESPSGSNPVKGSHKIVIDLTTEDDEELRASKRANSGPESPKKRQKPISMHEIFDVPPFTERHGESFEFSEFRSALNNEDHRVRQYNKPVNSNANTNSQAPPSVTPPSQLQIHDSAALLEYTSESEGMYQALMNLHADRQRLLNSEGAGAMSDASSWAKNLESTYDLLTRLLQGTERSTKIAFNL